MSIEKIDVYEFQLQLYRELLEDLLDSNSKIGSDPSIATAENIQATRKAIRLVKYQIYNLEVRARRIPYTLYSIEQMKHTLLTQNQLVPPPQFGTFLLQFLPTALREDVLGDMEERFQERCTRFSHRKAVILYYWEILISFWPFIKSWIEKLVKLGLLGWVGDILRHLVS